MRYQSVLFDMDGTVLDTLEDMYESVNHTLRAFGYPERTRGEVRAFVGNGAYMLIRRALPEGSSEEQVQQALALYKPYYAAHCQVRTKPYDGILELFSTLGAHGIRVAIVSNKPDGAVKTLSERYFGALPTLAVGEREGRRCKPYPDMVLAALEEMGAAASRAVYVGDSEVDVQTAKNAGLPCISVSWGFRSRRQLVFAGAAVIADSVKELKKLLIE